MLASELFERYYLETRSKLLDIAANLDRIARAEGTVDTDPRRIAIDEALRVLLDGGPDRAERLQMIFSRPYDENWLAGFEKQTGTRPK